MPNITIDPTNLKPNEAQILGKLLSRIDIGTSLDTKGSYPIKVSLDGVEVEYKVKLKFPIYKESQKNSRVLLKEIGAGGQGKIFLAGTVTLDQNNIAVYKEDAQHERVVKDYKSDQVLVFNVNNYTEEVKDDSERAIKKKSKIQRHFPELHAKHTLTKDFAGTDYWVSTSMHKAPGKNLGEIIAKESKKLTPELRFEISRRLSIALKKIHDAGITHADIKPDNVMVDIDYASNRVRSLKIIDPDLAADQNDYVSATTPGYSAPEFDRDKRVDIYAAGISLLETWGALSKAVKTPESYPERSNFKPQTRISDPSLPIPTQENLDMIFQGMTAEKNKRTDADNLIEQFDRAELDYVLTNLELSQNNVKELKLAHQLANEFRIILEKTATQNYSSVEEYIATQKEMMYQMLGQLKKLEITSPFAIMEFTKILSINALRGCDDVSQIEKKLNEHLSLFTQNSQTLANSNNNAAHRWQKKLEKCRTFDEIVEFNNLYTDKINHLANSNNNAPKAKADIKTMLLDEIGKAKTYDDLLAIYIKIKNEEKAIKIETGSFYSAFGKYGVTDTWQNIINNFQQKALEIGNQEIAEKFKGYSEGGVDFSNKKQMQYLRDHMQERYNKFFVEKSGRIFQNSCASDFDKSLQSKFSVSNQGLKIV